MYLFFFSLLTTNKGTKIPAKDILDLSLDENSLITVKAVTKEGRQKYQLKTFVFQPEDSEAVKSWWSDSINSINGAIYPGNSDKF